MNKEKIVSLLNTSSRHTQSWNFLIAYDYYLLLAGFDEDTNKCVFSRKRAPGYIQIAHKQ